MHQRHCCRWGLTRGQPQIRSSALGTRGRTRRFQVQRILKYRHDYMAVENLVFPRPGPWRRQVIKSERGTHHASSGCSSIAPHTVERREIYTHFHVRLCETGVPAAQPETAERNIRTFFLRRMQLALSRFQGGPQVTQTSKPSMYPMGMTLDNLEAYKAKPAVQRGISFGLR